MVLGSEHPVLGPAAKKAGSICVHDHYSCQLRHYGELLKNPELPPVVVWFPEVWKGSSCRKTLEHGKRESLLEGVYGILGYV
jgi:hypothetical protein